MKIKKLLFFVVGLCLTIPSWSMDNPEPTHVNVAILGGGLSGLTAAYELQKLGIRSTIYEGRDRLGGRVNTHYFNKE